MNWKLWAACLTGCLSGPAAAADWWWIGLNGDAPMRVVTYVDQETAAAGKDGGLEVWVLAIGESALPNGQQHQATRYGLRCRQQSLAALGRIAYDSAGSALPLADPPPENFTRAVAGSIGESILQLVCGRPSGMEMRVADPVAHAAQYFGVAVERSARPDGSPGGEARANLSIGTGFFVGPQGHVLTSYHVVEGAARIACRTSAGDIFPATVERASRTNDLALLRVEHRPASYLTLAPPGSLRAGDRVFTIGYGAANFLGVNEPRFTEGAIIALSGYGAEDVYMQISVPVQPGNSGGPLVNEHGQVVGIVAAQAAVDAFLEAEGTLPQSINWAVKADYAAPLIGPLPPAPRRTREQAIERVRGSVCLLLVDGGAAEGE